MKGLNNIIIRYKLWVPAIWSFVAVIVFAFVLSWFSYPQALTLKGTYVANDSRVFHRFIDGIKKKNGILVLGTSETGNNLDGKNYWGLLNADKDVQKQFSVLAGAGRDYTMYFPLILKNPDLFEDAQLFVYINPTYWRESLCEFSNDYFTRYNSKQLAGEVKEIAQKKGIYDNFIKPARFDGIAIDSIKADPSNLGAIVYDIKTYFSYDLKRLINDREKISGKDKVFNSLNSEQEARLKEGINLEYNALESFVQERAPFPAVNTECTHRYFGLLAFIRLCQEYRIRATFYLGPYNAVYCRKTNPENLAAYEDLLVNIRAILQASKMPFIDGSNLSYISGTFLDVQHTSQYGAFLTAMQIKKHYEKIDKNSH